MTVRKHRPIASFIIIVFFLMVSFYALKGTEKEKHDSENYAREFGSIQPYRHNPWFWELNGEPIMLRASDDDNLFQWTGDKLINHLDLLGTVGGNYLRCALSDRDEGNVYPYKKIDEKKYDLDQWNDWYWNRLGFFLDETEKRGMVVQLTLWDYFDLLRNFKGHPTKPGQQHQSC